MRDDKRTRAIRMLFFYLPLAIVGYFFWQFKRGMFQKAETMLLSGLAFSAALFSDVIFSLLTKRTFASTVIDEDEHPTLFWILVITTFITGFAFLAVAVYYFAAIFAGDNYRP